MAAFNIQSVIGFLGDLASGSQVDLEKVDDAIDELERIKSSISADDDEAIDKLDEVQDYLQFLLSAKEPSMEEVKEEIVDIIDDLRKWPK